MEAHTILPINSGLELKRMSYISILIPVFSCNPIVLKQSLGISRWVITSSYLHIKGTKITCCNTVGLERNGVYLCGIKVNGRCQQPVVV